MIRKRLRRDSWCQGDNAGRPLPPSLQVPTNFSHHSQLGTSPRSNSILGAQNPQVLDSSPVAPQNAAAANAVMGGLGDRSHLSFNSTCTSSPAASWGGALAGGGTPGGPVVPAAASRMLRGSITQGHPSAAVARAMSRLGRDGAGGGGMESSGGMATGSHNVRGWRGLCVRERVGTRGVVSTSDD